MRRVPCEDRTMGNRVWRPCRSLDLSLEFALQRHSPGPGQFSYPERLEHVDDGIYLLLTSGRFEHDRFGADIDHFCPENLRDLHGLGPGRRRRLNLHQDQLALYEWFKREVDDLDRIDELVKLLDNLFDDLVVSMGDDRHARDFFFLGRP